MSPHAYNNRVLARLSLLDRGREERVPGKKELVMVKLRTLSDNVSNVITFPAAKALIEKAVPGAKITGDDSHEVSYVKIKREDLALVRVHLRAHAKALNSNKA